MQVDLINAMRLVDQRADLELTAKGQIAGQQPPETKVALHAFNLEITTALSHRASETSS